MSDPSKPAGEPPTPPLLRRGLLLRLFLWVTEPTLIKGISIGIVLSLVITVGTKLDAVWYVASGLLLIAVAMIFGVIIGHYIFETRKKRLQKNALGLISEASSVLPAISEDILALVTTQDAQYLQSLWARLYRIKPSLRELSTLMVAMVFRVMAMSTLIAVLGGAISFAVFLATYLQVERMGQQNELLSAQNLMIKEQTELFSRQIAADKEAREVDLSLSTAAQRQAIVLGLIDAVDSEVALIKQDRVSRGEGLSTVRDDDDHDNGERIRISAGMYRRIQRTLSQLDPYRVVDPETMRASGNARSPEQELLLHYLEGSSVDLRSLSLRRAYFVEADLRELEIGEINLNEANFDRAVMREIDLSDAYLEAASFVEIDGQGASFGAAHMSRARLRGAKLKGADLSSTDLSAADLSYATLRQATFEGADLRKAKLWGVDLAEADMSGQLRLKGADLSCADFSTIDQAPQVQILKKAANWQLAVYSDAIAAALGIPEARQTANKEALTRLRAAATMAEKDAIVEALQAAGLESGGG